MISDNLKITDLDQSQLRHWWELAIPKKLGVQSNYVVLILDQGTLVHALRSGDGAIDIQEIVFNGTQPKALTILKTQMATDALLVIEKTALTDLFYDFEQSLSLQDDFTSQGIGLWKCLRESQGIYTMPPILELIPPLSSQALERTLNTLVPDNRSVLFYIIDSQQAKIHASVIAYKEKGTLSLITMHPAIGHLVTQRELCRDWQKNYHRINDAVQSQIGKPVLSIFIEYAALIAILEGPPEQFSAELKARRLIFDPAPLWVQGLLGGAAVAALATQNAKRAARFLPKSARQFAKGAIGIAGERMRSTGASPFAMLGFDPIELVQKIRAIYANSHCEHAPTTPRK